ncbi:MAG: NOP58 family protein [Candidatus Aenigmarchaeota archaeon]|nr:NOP58 family protein [Candidatus Aenigmarchaeota archaeon]
MKKAFLSRMPAGIFIFDEAQKLLEARFFSKNPVEAAEEYEKPLTLAGYEIRPDDSLGRALARKISVEKGHFSSDHEYTEFLSGFAAAFSLKKLEGSVGKDKLLQQSMNALLELEDMESMLGTRLKEWFTLHYPEERSQGKELGKKVAEFGKRENFPGFAGSTGVAMDSIDEAAARKYASLFLATSDCRRDTEAYIRNLAEKVMPTTSTIVNPMLAARLLAHAGSLEKLSRMAASSIQLLGAEKALFRHIKNQGKSPKYGIIFMDPRIQSAPPETKGKVARAIAAKIMVAVKIDFFSRRKDETLAKQLEKELAA